MADQKAIFRFFLICALVTLFNISVGFILLFTWNLPFPFSLTISLPILIFLAFFNWEMVRGLFKRSPFYGTMYWREA